MGDEVGGKASAVSLCWSIAYFHCLLPVMTTVASTLNIAARNAEYADKVENMKRERTNDLRLK